jgi:hypothetical protein
MVMSSPVATSQKSFQVFAILIIVAIFAIVAKKNKEVRQDFSKNQW